MVHKINHINPNRLMTMTRNPVAINGVNVYPFSSTEELLNFVKNEKKILVSVNAEKILHAATDGTKTITNDNIGYADGIGTVFALKKMGYKSAVKIAGCELWLKIIERYYMCKSFYLIGGKQDVIEQTVKKLQNQFSKINIVGYRNGYFNETEKNKIIKDIQEKRPDIVFVATGSPMQEIFMGEMLAVHPTLYMGLGGSFDVYTDNVKRAPKRWVELNLEWAYRLLKQPRRIKRQIHLIKFVIFLLFRVRRRRNPPSPRTR